MALKYIGPDRPFSDIGSSSMEECVRWVGDTQVLGIDTETSGLDFTAEKLVMLQIGDQNVQWCIDARYIDVSVLAPLLAERLCVGHNLKFDYCFLLNAGIRLNRIWDTMLAEQVLNCGKKDFGFGLDVVLKERFGIVMADLSKGFTRMHGEQFSDAQLTYGALDVEHLLPLMKAQHLQLKEQGLLNVMSLENAACLAFADIEYNGLSMDVPMWLGISSEEQKKLSPLRKELDDMVLADPRFRPIIPAHVQGDLFGAPRRITVSWDSPMQVLKVLRCLEPSLPAVNATDLFPFRNLPLVKKYIEYKETCKLVSSYGEEFLKQRFSDGKVHTRFKQILNTGRVSSSEPNMQQLPAINKFRNCFICEPSSVYVSGDYAS
jgi:DNA polymerase I-like protein with 3'-5' exonuclease and polymerase domains